MITLREGNLEFTFPTNVMARKFDNASHGLSYCMKAVDFIVEEPRRTLYIEIKDPDHPKTKPQNREKFVSSYQSGELNEQLKYKYRDSFIYEWASKSNSKPIHYFVLIVMDSIESAELLTLSDQLSRSLPIGVNSSTSWKRPIATECIIFNINSWNRHLPNYPVNRL